MKVMKFLILVAICTTPPVICSPCRRVWGFTYCENITSLDQISYEFDGHEYTDLRFGNSNISILSSLYFIPNLKWLSRFNFTGIHVKVIDPGAFNGLTTLRILHLDHNELTELSNGVFDGLTNLTNLTLAHNKIHKIEKLALAPLVNLEELVLDYNHLSNLASNKISRIGKEFFLGMTELVYLNISSNRVEVLESGVFDSMVNLQTLDISNNRLVDLHQYALDPLSKLEDLHIDNNQISSLDAQDLITYHSLLKNVVLDKNPWDCKVLWKIIATFEVNGITTPPIEVHKGINVKGVTCSRKIILEKSELEDKETTKNNDTILIAIVAILVVTIVLLLLIILMMLVFFKKFRILFASVQNDRGRKSGIGDSLL